MQNLEKFCLGVMLNELQVVFHLAAHKIVVCALAQKPGIGVLTERTLFVTNVHQQSGFDGIDCSMASLAHASKVSMGHAECMC